MIARMTAWLGRKWQSPTQTDVLDAYRVTFGSLHGQLVLQHLMDTIYCQVYEGTDAQAALVFNARRSVIHEILYNVDVATRPDHYTLKETSHG